MELRSVEELMDLLCAGRHQHALRTAALLRRGRPADKELQVAGLVQGIGPVALPGRRGGPGRGPRRRRCAPCSENWVFRLVRGDAGPATTRSGCARPPRRAARPASTRAYWRTGVRCWSWWRPGTRGSARSTDGRPPPCPLRRASPARRLTTCRARSPSGRRRTGPRPPRRARPGRRRGRRRRPGRAGRGSRPRRGAACRNGGARR